MVESPNRIGGGGAALPSQTAEGRAPRAAGTNQRGNRAPTPFGPRGSRMLSPDTPIDQLDRSAPRGTYLDILV